MRIERWYWLIVFGVVSLAIHVGVVLKSRAFYAPPIIPKLTEIEVALEPLKEEPPKEPVKQPEPPKPKAAPPEVKQDKQVMKKLLASIDRKQPAMPLSVRSSTSKEKANAAHAAEPGGNDPLKEEKPITSGLKTGFRDAGVPKLDRMARLDPNPGGGGSPAPSNILSGTGGAPGPEAPPEDILFNGGGAGGEKLPRAAPRMGGGGGRSILSVENPLAKDAIPEDKPGLGPGGGGGQGHGSGGGVGEVRDRGIGTRLDGKVALGTLRAKPGIGIGAGKGDGIGTNPPGGGKGTGSELPGTGGSGLGYGRGSGIGVGNGSGSGIGDGAGARVGRMRGVPFGDVAGLLNGDPNGGGGTGGGPGGRGRGAVFGAGRIGGGGGGKVSIVYVMDTSGSMRDDNKIGKAKEALKKALHELKPSDSFNVINFDRHVHLLSEEMMKATPENIREADQYIDEMRLHDYTNISGALEVALSMEGITHVFLMSDGEPHGGIEDYDEMRDAVKQWNEKKVVIHALALGLGDKFPGMVLLRGLAEDNKGEFNYVNMRKVGE
jgi:hypothetical protein